MNLTKPKQNPNPSQQQATTKNGGWTVVPPELKPYTPEWFLLNYLENWNDGDVGIAIKNDVRPDLSMYADLILDQTTDFFLNFLKTQRPDLTQIQTKDGREWIRRIIKSATGFG